MPTVTIENIPVDFPFEPYKCQIDYMSSVIKCLQNGSNGILESPTGTGKTLCLLCATLAWLESRKAIIELEVIKSRHAISDSDDARAGVYTEELTAQLARATGGWDGNTAPPKILYSSRTHSQLSQAMQELKRTVYSSKKACVLGSRDQLCIHPQIRKEQNVSTKVHMCRAKVNSRTCHFYNNVDMMKHHFQQEILDVEDLVKVGEKQKSCPYYTARELKNESDIVFMPYNYLLDPKARRAHGIDLQGSIVIFDEAHNLEKICEDSVSFDLSSYDLATCIEELKHLGESLAKLAVAEIQADDAAVNVDVSSNNALPDFSLQNVIDLKQQLIDLEGKIDQLELTNTGLTKPGIFMFELLSSIGITFMTKCHTVDLLEKIVTHLTNESGAGLMRRGHGISKLLEILKMVFSSNPERVTVDDHQKILSKYYKVHVSEEQKDWKKKDQQKQLDPWARSAPKAEKAGRTLSYWCFSPGLCMKDIQSHGVKTIILTSGTLSPIDSFEKEMGIDFKIRLENPHIIEQHQFMVAVVPKGPDSKKLNSSYHNRSTDAYRQSLGNSVVNFARTVPNGLLLFFPSYPVMSDCIQFWERANIHNRITDYKPLFLEPRSKVEFIQTIELFYERVNDVKANGAIFSAVCRGKASEGLDFADNNGRAVVITGLPYPPRMDPKVVLKMAFLDDSIRAGNKNGLSGNLWYKQQASRAVNQAIGRVIRHKNDFGAILLCDERFGSSDSRAQLPAWVRPYVVVHDHFGSVMRALTHFFRTTASMPVPVKKPDVVRPKRGEVAGTSTGGTQPSQSKRAVRGPHQELSASKSRELDSHVPGMCMKRTPDAVALAKLKIEYEDKNPSKQLGGGITNLLGALDSHSQSFSQSPDELGTPSMAASATSRYDALTKRAMEKSRIKVRKPAAADSGDVKKKSSKENSARFVRLAKESLDKKSYSRFLDALKVYAAENEFAKLVPFLTEVLSTKDRHHLLLEFRNFVKLEHMRQFDDLCRSITGAGGSGSTTVSRGAGEGPTDKGPVLGSKRKHEGSEKVKVDSGTKAGIQGSSTRGPNDIDSNRPTTSCEQQSKRSKTEPVRLEIVYEPPDFTWYLCQFLEAKSRFKSTYTKTYLRSLKERLDPSGEITAKPRPEKYGFKETSKEMKPDGNNNGGAKKTEAKRTLMGPPTAPASMTVSSVPPDSARSGYTCRSCGEDARVALQAPCEHICCFGCWKKILSSDGAKTCPECCVKVKRKQLVQMRFPSGPNLPENKTKADISVL